MPDYLPTPQLPVGMAEENLRLQGQRKSNWQALAENVTGLIGQGTEAYGQHQQQMQALKFAIDQGLIKPEQMGPRLPSGQQGAPQPVPTMQSYPGGLPGGQQTLSELMSLKKSEEMSREATTRTIEASKEKAGLTEVPVTDMHRQQYKKVYGHDIPFEHLTQAQEKQLSDQFKAKSSPTLGIKDTQFKQKRITQFGDALDPEKKRSGSFGLASQKFNRAEGLESLASAFPDANLDSRQIEELAIGLNSMLSGSNTGAQQQVQSLVPKTIYGDANKLKEWLVNEPTGTNQQEFVKRLLGTIQREKSTASDQIKREQLSITPSFADLEKSNPQEFYDILEARGITKDEYLEWKKGGRKRKSAVQKSESNKAPHQMSDKELLDAL